MINTNPNASACRATRSSTSRRLYTHHGVVRYNFSLVLLRYSLAAADAAAKNLRYIGVVIGTVTVDVISRAESCVDPSAAADRQIRRRKFGRRISAGKFTARRISRRILLAVLYCVVLKSFQ